MNVSQLFLIIFLVSTSANAQGFAGLGTTADGFSVPDPAYQLQFPEDHGAHPDFRIEWWYLTANLQDAQARDYGVQWTLFRLATAPSEEDGWNSPQVWMGHAAVTTASLHRFAERIARGGIGQAGATAAPFEAWIDHWFIRNNAGETTQEIHASGDDFSYNIKLIPDGPIVAHGVNGYSVKSAEGQASHYYSQPHFQAQGTLELDGTPVSVTGHAWFDREWSSQPLASDQTGWDWFSLRFDGGAKLMAFVLRGSGENFTSGTWISPDGTASALPHGSVQATPLFRYVIDGRSIPTRWQINVPEYELSVEVEALNPSSWMDTSFSYWEGPVHVSGSHVGRGYLEMTGYE